MKSFKFIISISLLFSGLFLIAAESGLRGSASLPFYKVDEKPLILKTVAPEYPILAKNKGIEGQVILKVIVSEEGRVENTNIIKSVFLLDQAAIDAVKQWKFKPGKHNGQEVAVEMLIPVKFKLKK